MIDFLQQNSTLICGLGMLVFAAVQVWFMFWQNKQPLQLKHLDLVQQLDEVAFEFTVPGKAR